MAVYDTNFLVNCKTRQWCSFDLRPGSAHTKEYGHSAGEVRVKYEPLDGIEQISPEDGNLLSNAQLEGTPQFERAAKAADMVRIEIRKLRGLPT